MVPPVLTGLHLAVSSRTLLAPHVLPLPEVSLLPASACYLLLLLLLLLRRFSRVRLCATP